MSSYTFHTEKEFVENDRYQVYRLSQLANKNRSQFEQISDYFPYAVHENKVSNLEYTYHNNQIENILKNEYEKLVKNGHSHILKIAEPKVHSHILKSIKAYSAYSDHNAVLTYFQCLKVEGTYTWVYSHKIFSGDSHFLNVSHPLENMGQLGLSIQDVLGEAFIKRNGWQLFDSLTKREKEIVKLMANGYSSQEISDQLYISKHTTDTHRRNIFQKLEVKNLATLCKFSQAFGLME